jgi:hypothetical protein
MGSGSKVQADWLSHKSGSTITNSPNGGAPGGVVGAMLEKLKRLERQLSDEYGSFNLFGLFLREGSNEKWDLVVAAKWLKSHDGDAIDLLSGRLKSVLGRLEIMMISRIVSLSETDRFLTAIAADIHVIHGLREISQGNFADVEIDRGYVITSDMRPPNAGAKG